ncbi:Ran-binding protein in the microtubule-organising centre protein (macronuclear) [Tetrahymena thermophila SB210]|uniref:Ran-binding protein in the microtubule-organising centre protein n=1 Tax=Tetrahymena thermophila (strain SB210) TaxID=312017 RepID=Q24DE5_TETTS|nr:Ran-binding protein in the microtubule-organising centre protein [Tetrahymena thermophila SB210]EAS05796.2 Ran-binding protein in the microtubule-organising centre protein [Tetrahymena thermophila SB210]|eukprot:XP_001026041.2 Ran-binding protein in the microtubule-organising centre protein [Tetrahymena thermophila SB210]
MQENQYDQLLKDVERIKKCSLITKQEISKSIDSVLELLVEAKHQINEPMEIEDQEVRRRKIKDSINNLDEKLREKKPLKSVIDSHKKYFQYLSKYGKNIEKIFKSDINNVFKDTLVSFEKECVNEAIAEHLLIEKKFELYENFLKETGLSHKIDKEKQNILKTIQKIFDEFQTNQLNEAIKWAQTKKEELEDLDSPLLFYLHRLQFIQNLQKGKMESIQYARKHFKDFFNQKKFADQAQQVMFYILLENGKIQDHCQLDQSYKQVEELLLDNYCKIYNLTIKSALLQCLIAGTLALPKFLKYTQISSMDEELKDYHNKNEYPIEVEIGKDFKYHSIFVCPISRDVIEPDQNPVWLTCGHVISEASMKKITASANKEKFKCPTCPKEMTARETKKIYF